MLGQFHEQGIRSFRVIVNSSIKNSKFLTRVNGVTVTSSRPVSILCFFSGQLSVLGCRLGPDTITNDASLSSLEAPSVAVVSEAR